MSGEWRILLMYPGKKTTSGSWSASIYKTPMGSPGTTDFSGATISSTGANSRNNFGDGAGLYSSFFTLKNISKIAFVDGSAGVLNPSSHSNYLIYDLCGTTLNESIRDILFRLDQYLRVTTNFAANDIFVNSNFAASSVTNFTAGTNGFSGSLSSSGGTGFRTNGSVLPTKFCVMGINTDSDNDIQALCAYSGNLSSGKGDSWRGDSPAETFWSYWGHDFHSDTRTQRIGVSLQTAPGVATGASWSTDVYMLAFSTDASSSTPAIPTGLSSSGITDTSYNLTWNSQTDASSYTIQRASDISFNNILQTYSGLTGTSRVISDVSSGTTYYNRIAAVNSNGTSSYYSGVTVLTIASAPIDLSANNITNNNLRLFWTLRTGATSYIIQRSSSNIFSSIDASYTSTDSSRNITSLSAGTIYYFRIASVNSSGTSSYSTSINRITQADTPSDLSSNNITNISLRLYWTAKTGATYYYIEQSRSNTFTLIDASYNVYDISKNISGICSNTNYYFRIASVNNSGQSSYTTHTTRTLSDGSTNFIASDISNTSIKLTWNNINGRSNNIIERSLYDNFSIIDNSYNSLDTSINLVDLSAGIQYYYRIRVLIPDCPTIISSGISVLTIATPPSPSINNLTYDSFRLTWLSKTGADYYNILVSTDINFLNIITDISVNDISYNIIGLNDYTNYYYKINSSNTTGNSYYSNTQIIKTHLYTGITDISDNLNSPTDLTNFLLNNLENVFDANQFKTYLRENKNNFISQIGTVTVADISGILSNRIEVTGLETVKFIVFDDNETIEISGNILNELRSGDILYLSGFDGDVINLLINSNNYTLILSSTGVIYNSILYELGNNFRLGNDIEFIVKLLGSGGLEGNGIGDPFINPVFGEKYYLPNDEETYLLFDNNDNLKIYTKTWFAPLMKKNKMSYMRYIIIDYNSKIFGIDLESMEYVKMSNKIDLDKMRLPRLKDNINKYNKLIIIDSNERISNYYGKKYKISRYNKKREIIFDCAEYKVILKLISDLAYEDIRNNVNIIFSGNINIDKLKTFRGAIISENKVKKIDCNKFFFNKSLYY
jgi:hypothetical protein